MFIKFQHVLTGNLAASGTLVFAGDFDEYRLAPTGHLIMVGDTRYASPTDFTIASDGSGDLTLTWLGATLLSGATLRVGIAYIDLMIGGLLAGAAGGGSGTADSTAALQTAGNNLIAAVQAIPGTDATKAGAVQGITGGKPVAVSGPLTDAQLRASTVPISGTVTANVGTGTQPVSGTFWQATQPVSGPLTDTQLRATALPVSGPLTDAQLRATALPVSGPLTDTQLRATALPISNSAGATSALQGVQGTGVQYNPPAGGSGSIGFLSGIFEAIKSPIASAVKDGGVPYEIVNVSQTDQIMGGAGAAGDVLAYVRWRAGATPTDIVIKDGVAGTTVFTIKAANQVASAEGTEFFGAIATTRWAITTGAGSSAVGAGTFT